MNEHQVKPRPEDVARDDESTFIEAMIVFAKYKKIIVGVPLAVAVIAAALSFSLPNVYRASTKLLPPQQQQSGASALLSQLGGMAGLAAGAAGIKNPTDVYIGMLKSRTVADTLIAKHDLKKLYGTESLEQARADLGGDTTIASGKDGLITIDVEGNDRKLVARLANAYVNELLVLTKTLAVTEAAQRRLFFEEQLEKSKNNLAKAEMSLKGALDAGGVISVDGESRALVETAARLKAQVSGREVELNAMRSFVTQEHPNFRRVEQELSSLRSELLKLENGRGGLPKQAGTAGTARGGLENIQLLRDLKYHQMLYELLAKQYEAARLDEAKDPSIIQVLDPAVEPERKIGPKRILIVLMSAFASLFAVVVFAFIAEAKKKALTSPTIEARWKELHSHLRG